MGVEAGPRRALAVRASPISVSLDGRDPESVTLTIRNRGVIDAAVLSRLFAPFRGTRPGAGHARGLGLGLFIVKELVEAHRGTVAVSATEPVGTTFTVVLPRAVPAAPGT